MKEIRIDRENNRIVMTRKFAMKADDPHTREFRLLQEVMETYPSFRVENHTIKKNPNKECYRGLTYEYMRTFIRAYESEENVESALAELEELIFISRGHSKGYRYPTIKQWFLDKYPNFAEFGKEINKSESSETEVEAPETEERKEFEVKFSNLEPVAA